MFYADRNVSLYCLGTNSGRIPKSLLGRSYLISVVHAFLGVGPVDRPDCMTKVYEMKFMRCNTYDYVSFPDLEPMSVHETSLR